MSAGCRQQDGKKGHEDSDNEEEDDEDAFEGVDGEIDQLTKNRSPATYLHDDVTFSTPLDKVDIIVSGRRIVLIARHFSLRYDALHVISGVFLTPISFYVQIITFSCASRVT